jgi:hypothetical protein
MPPPLSVHDPNTGNQPARQPKRNAQTDFGLPCATRTDYHQPLSVLSNIWREKLARLPGFGRLWRASGLGGFIRLTLE